MLNRLLTIGAVHVTAARARPDDPAAVLAAASAAGTLSGGPLSVHILAAPQQWTSDLAREVLADVPPCERRCRTEVLVPLGVGVVVVHAEEERIGGLPREPGGADTEDCFASHLDRWSEGGTAARSLERVSGPPEYKGRLGVVEAMRANQDLRAEVRETRFQYRL